MRQLGNIMLNSSIEQIIKKDCQDKIIHGAVVLSGNLSTIQYQYEFGFADFADQHPFNADTVIDMASATKVTVGITSLLLLHSRGLIDFDAPFTDYLPEYQPKLQTPISIRQLANHTSGFSGAVRPYFDESGKIMTQKVLELPPTTPPTATADYACWNYIILAMVIEKISGMSLIQFAEKNIFQPLAMADSFLGTPKPGIPIERLAQTMGCEKPGQISDFVAKRIFRDGYCTCNAGLFSSANDLTKLLRCYLQHGETPTGDELFSPESFAEITPNRQSNSNGYRHFGWEIYDPTFIPDRLFGQVLYHSGWSGQTILFNVPKNTFAMVLSSRCGDYDRTKKERFTIIEELIK